MFGNTNRYMLEAANGGFYAAASNFESQIINMASGAQPDFQLSDLSYATAFGTVFGGLSAKIPGLTSGNNSWNARYLGRLTARANGHIVNIGIDTSARAAVANNVVPVMQSAAATAAEIARRQ